MNGKNHVYAHLAGTGGQASCEIAGGHIQKQGWLPLASFISLFVGIIAFLLISSVTSKDFHSKNEVKKYTLYSKLQWDWALSSLESYHFNGNESVLDLGCGEGKITAELARRVPAGRVIGLDISPAMINFASSRYPRSEYRNLLFMQADATKNPFNEQFDLIVSSCALHFIEDQKTVVAGIKQALSLGGRALLVMPEAYPYNLSPVSERLAQSERWQPYFEQLNVPLRYYKSAYEYEQIVKEAGFKVLSIKSIPIDDQFKNRDTLVEWILTISSFAKALPQELQRQFAEEAADGMLTECPPPCVDGTVILRSPKLEVWVMKNEP
ncbi:MAG: methyltransferase domain-containing protein [Verrucomicrobia bacterium]|nr:methyltransferase domain-containing protein [Verrucomicrobiota bacterium]